MKYIGPGDFMNGLTSRLGQHKRILSKLEKKYEKNQEIYSGGCRDGNIRKIKRHAKQLRDMQNHMRRSNINLTRVNLPEGENKGETILQTLTEFSCPDKSINSQIKESQFIAKDKYKDIYKRHIVIKLQSNGDENIFKQKKGNVSLCTKKRVALWEMSGQQLQN